MRWNAVLREPSLNMSQSPPAPRPRSHAQWNPIYHNYMDVCLYWSHVSQAGPTVRSEIKIDAWVPSMSSGTCTPLWLSGTRLHEPSSVILMDLFPSLCRSLLHTHTDSLVGFICNLTYSKDVVHDYVRFVFFLRVTQVQFNGVAAECSCQRQIKRLSSQVFEKSWIMCYNVRLKCIHREWGLLHPPTHANAQTHKDTHTHTHTHTLLLLSQMIAIHHE